MNKLLSKYHYILLALVIILGIVIIATFVWLSLRQPSPTELTSEERQLRNAPTQNYLIPEPQITQPGVLIVQSEPSEARVVIDAPEEEGGGSTAEGTVPVNVTPFRVDAIPAGKHNLLVSKPGYEFQELEVEIKPGEITRLNVKLNEEFIPQPPVKDWQSQLPITNDRYSITFNSQEGIVIVMRLQSSTAEAAQEEAQQLSDEIKDKLEEIGVPTSSERITWRVE